MIKPYYIKGVHRVKKKTSVQRYFANSCSCKFCKIHKKTPVLLFNEVAGIKRVHHKCFPMKCFF